MYELSPSERALAQQMRQCAMDALGRREHSKGELQQKLVLRFKEASAELIEAVITHLSEQNLQSDQRCVETFVRYRASRGVGPLKIRAELRSKEIASDLISEALSDGTQDWYELCSEVLSRKFRLDSEAKQVKPDRQEQLRWQRFLLQRGFTQEQVRYAIESKMTTAKN